MKIQKKEVIEKAIARLGEELEALTQAALAAREAATHEESRAEDQHDTRGLEASYLAGAQAARAAELQKLIVMFRNFPTREFGEGEAIAIGALVELESLSKRSFHLLAGAGGGISVSMGAGITVQVITPAAPLGDALLGKHRGDSVDVEMADRVREYEVISVT